MFILISIRLLHYNRFFVLSGADSAILDNLSRAVDDKTKLRIFRTQQHLNIYSKKGLRVLCMAKRVLTEAEYEDWAMKHKEAENALSNRERKLQDSYLRIEKNLSLIGRLWAVLFLFFFYYSRIEIY